MSEPKQQPADIDVCIINYNTAQLTLDCIQSLLNSNSAIRYSIIVVDNASRDDSVTRIKQVYPNITVVPLSENLGYGAAFNIGLRHSHAPYCCIANSDLLFHSSTLSDVVRFMSENESVGCCGVQQNYPNGAWQRSFGILPGIADGVIDIFGGSFIYRTVYPWLLKRFRPLRKPHHVSYIDGAFMCFRRTALDDVNGFDERFTFFGEDCDISKRLSLAGHGVMFLPAVGITHIRGGSRDAHSEKDFRYLHINTAARYLLAQTYCSETATVAWSVMQTWYYATLTVVYSLLYILFRNPRKASFKHRMRLSWHLVGVNLGFLQQLLDKKTITIPKL